MADKFRRLLSRDGSRSANEHEIRRIRYLSFNNPYSIYMVITKLSDPKLPLSRAVKESTSSRQRIISVRAKEMGQGESFSRMRRISNKSNDLELFTGDGFLIFLAS